VERVKDFVTTTCFKIKNQRENGKMGAFFSDPLTYTVELGYNEIGYNEQRGHTWLVSVNSLVYFPDYNEQTTVIMNKP